MDAMNKLDRLKRKIRVLSRLVFGRTAMVLVAVLLQVAMIVVGSNLLYKYFAIYYMAFQIIGLIVVVHILNEDTNAGYKMAWIVPVLAFPVCGIVVYLFVNFQVDTKIMRIRLDSVNTQISRHIRVNEEYTDRIKNEPDGEINIAKYLYSIGNFTPYYGNECEFFPLGDDKWEEMLKQLRQAEHFIFMEYFIVADRVMWRSVKKILEEKAAEGVEVRFMYDGMNSLVNVPFGFYKKLAERGINARPFSQIRPALSTVQNNRDHRKILIIDGKVAFTGGINLADEYVNKYERFGHWKDTAIMIKGNAVKSFTYMFLTMWNVAGKRNSVPEEELNKYIPDFPTDECLFDIDKENDKLRSGGFVIPYGDSPFDDERVGKQIYIDILNRATRYVHIMTPYLILDDELIQTLSHAAVRGVETVIIMPHIPDKKYAYLLARSYYRKLLEKGVKIYEYTPGFVHAKEFISDDIRGTVGSVNLDYRSLYLHFECGTYIYNNGCIKDIEDDFQATLEKCQEITIADCDNYPWIKKTLGRIFRLIAPLM